MDDRHMTGFEKCMLGVVSIVFGLPIIGGIINSILDTRNEHTKLKNRDEKIRKLQENGAKVNINLNGEV